jgi:PAS domain S-box-containing protein
MQRWFSILLPRSPKSIAWLAILIVFAISFLALAGWMLDITLLKSVRPGWIRMSIITATCLLLSATGLALLQKGPSSVRKPLILQAPGILVGLMALLNIVLYAFAIITGQDSSLGGAPILNLFWTPVTRMALLTAILFLMVGSALVLLATGSRRASTIAHALMLPAAMASYLVPVSYLLGVERLHESLQTPVALHTGIAFCVLSIAIFCSRPDTWLMSVFTDDHLGGVMARRLLPALLVIPLVIGWLRLYGERVGAFKSEVGVALVALTYTFCLLWLVWKTARSVNRTDVMRRQIDDALRESEKRYRSLVDMSPECIAVHRDGQLLYVNPAGARLLGASNPDEVIGRSIFDIVPPDRLEIARARVRQVQEEGLPTPPLEGAYVRFDGTPFWGEATGTPITYDGKPSVQVIIRDVTGRKQAEEQTRRLLAVVQEEKDRLSALVNGIQDEVWFADTEKKFTLANPSALRALSLGSIAGVDVEKLAASLDVYRPDGSPRPVDEAPPLRALKGEVVRDEEETVRTSASGEFRHRQVSASPVRDGSGTIIGSVSVVRDITEHKRMEEELLRSRDELEARVEERTAQLSQQAALLDLAHDAIIVRTSDGKIAFWSSGAEATYGFTREEAMGKPVDALLHTKFPVPFEEIMDIAERENRWEGELIHRCKTGKQIVVLSRWALRKDDAGRPAEILEINRDISERKEAEQLLARVSAYNRSLLETSLDPLVTIDPAGKINDVNAATERVTGYPRERLVGTDFSDYFTDPARARAGYKKVFEEGFVRDYRLEIRHRDGDVTSVLYNASVYKDDAGSVLGVFAAARDITEQLKLEAQLRQTQKMEAIGTLAGGIAHDLNNILAAIIGFTELVIDDVSDNADVQHKMEQVLKAGFRGRDLVRQVLAFSRKTEGERKEISLTSLVKETQALLRAALPSTIAMDLAITTTDDYVRADLTQLQQVLMNLATNAAYAMREDGGLLTIGISSVTFSERNLLPDSEMEPGTYVKLAVKDTGTGMTDEVRRRIFEPFFTTKQQGQGTGMGLAVVYGLVKSHGGAVTVQSEIGQGSVFEVFLPQAQKPEAKTEQTPTSVLPSGTERILFVDDEELIVETARRVLAGLGYRVTTAQQGSEAWDLFVEDPFRFDLVITDQTMPAVTGVMLAQKMLEVRKNIPIILCTGHSDSVSADKAKDAGIRAFVMKPVTRKELAETIRGVLDSQEG